MNRIQRWVVRLACRVSPQLTRLLRSANYSLESLSLEVDHLRENNSYERLQAERMAAELREAVALSGSGPWRGGIDVTPVPARESRGSIGVQPAVLGLRERLWELELALEDRGWKRQLAIAATEFSRYGIQQLILISRLYFIKNPLIRRGVQVSADYVFGRGFEISSQDEAANETIGEFLKANKSELGQAALCEKHEQLNTDGNIFFAFFTDVQTGTVQVRTIDPTEISEIVCDPEDQGKPWYYKRDWMYQDFSMRAGIVQPATKTTWYVDIDYNPPDRPTEIGGKPIATEASGDYVRILHFKDGGLCKWHFAAPPIYAALDWARAYRHFLEDWASITRALARFAWNVETQGGQGAIAALKQTLATTLANDGVSIETNPTPTVASSFVTGPGNKLTPVKTAGSTTEPEQGRRVMLMVAAAMGLPETFFGDASTGSLATALSLDRPTELKFLRAQEKWREVLQRICQYALERSATAPRGRLKEAREKNPAPQPVTIDVKFPAILEHDINARVGAITEALTLNQPGINGIDLKTGVGLLLSELGVEDVQSVLDAMYPEGSYKPERDMEAEPAEPTPEAVDKAVEAIRKAVAKNGVG